MKGLNMRLMILRILIPFAIGCVTGFSGYSVFVNGCFSIKNFLFLALWIIIANFVLEKISAKYYKRWLLNEKNRSKEIKDRYICNKMEK